jgi:hypothetical protein
MAVAAQTKLAALLEKCQLFQPSQVEELLGRHQSSGRSITDVVVELGYAREDAFLKALAGAMACRTCGRATWRSTRRCWRSCPPRRSSSTT